MFPKVWHRKALSEPLVGKMPELGVLRLGGLVHSMQFLKNQQIIRSKGIV